MPVTCLALKIFFSFECHLNKETADTAKYYSKVTITRLETNFLNLLRGIGFFPQSKSNLFLVWHEKLNP